MSGTVPVTWMRGSSAASWVIFGGGVRPTMARVAVGAVFADQREDLADEVEHAIDVGEPVHGADEDEVGGGRGGRGGRAEVFDVDAGGDFGDAGDVEEAAHFVGIGLGDGDDVAGRLADAALVAVHAIGLEFEVGAAQGIGGVLDVAAPDHGFDVVLEEDGVRQVGEVTGGREVIDHGAIEAFLADEVFEEGAHAGRMEALDGDRGGREESADEFGVERGAGLGGNAVA